MQGDFAFGANWRGVLFLLTLAVPCVLCSRWLSFLVANTVNYSICSCPAASYSELQFARYYFAPSDCGIAVSRLLHCAKVLGNSNLQGLALCQALWNYNLQGPVFRQQAMGGLQFQGSCLASNYWGYSILLYWGITLCKVLFCSKHLVDYNLQRRSSYFLNTSNHFSIAYTDTIIHLKHSPSCGDSGSSYMLSTPPPLAIPVPHNIS